jgi:crossover junction endodeoxyribonuclease RuvC
MIVLGIDPGIGRMGWGVVVSQGSKVKAMDYGCLETSKDDEDSERLAQVYKHVEKIIKKYKPDAIVVEELFFNTNVKTAMIVGQARGVVIVSGAMNKVPVFSYTPPEIKTAVTGYGKADKAQVGQMVKAILGLATVPKLDDTSDALAAGITHVFSNKMTRLGK